MYSNIKNMGTTKNDYSPLTPIS